MMPTTKLDLRGYYMEGLRDKAVVLTIVGAILGLIGFLLPWFGSNAHSWHYNSFTIFNNLAQVWIIIVYVGYLFLIFGTAGLIKKAPIFIAVVAVMTFLLTLVAIIIAFASATSFSTLQWNFGFLALIPGMAMLLCGGIGVWLAQTLHEAFKAVYE